MLERAFPLSQRLTLLVLLLVAFGQLMLFSASGVLGVQRHGSEFYYVLRQGIAAGVGLALMYLISQVRYGFWSKIAYLLFFLQICLVAATYTPLGHHALGATRWLRLGPVAFQPSELGKVTLAIYMARVLADSLQGPIRIRGWILRFLAPLALILLIFKQPDLGTTVLLTSVILGMFFISGMKLRYLLGLVGAGALVLVTAMVSSDYRRRRLFAFLNPWADPQGSGFQTIQSFLSIRSGKILGSGLGNGNSKLFFLPEVHTDFIYSLIGEELGFVGALALLLGFLYFSYLLFRVAIRCKDPFGCYLAFGIALFLVLQIAVNLGGVTGILPVKGLPLPFISWGRSALIVNLAMIGILLNISKHQGPAPA